MSSDIVIRPPDTAIVEAESAPVVARAQVLVVADEASRDLALKAVAYNAGRVKFIETNLLGDVIASAHNAWKGLTSLRARLTGPFVEANRILNQKATAWEAADAAKKQAEARALQAQIQKEADERRMIEINDAMEAGDEELVKAINAEPVAVPVIQPELVPSTVEGVQKRISYKARMTDNNAFILFVAKGIQAGDPFNWGLYLTPNMPMLNKLAASQREAFKLPGVEAEQVVTRAVRSSATATDGPDIPY